MNLIWNTQNHNQMEILKEIKEVSEQIIETLHETDFFSDYVFISEEILRMHLELEMQKKWEQTDETFMLSDVEFVKICEVITKMAINETLTEMVLSNKLNMGVNEDVKIVYSINEEANKDEF